jgi:hypothetical protein
MLEAIANIRTGSGRFKGSEHAPSMVFHVMHRRIFTEPTFRVLEDPRNDKVNHLKNSGCVRRQSDYFYTRIRKQFHFAGIEMCRAVVDPKNGNRIKTPTIRCFASAREA